MLLLNVKLCFCFFLNFVCLFCSTGVCIQGLMLAKQVLYHLSHVPSL
jgi:hypothetical protein